MTYNIHPTFVHFPIAFLLLYSLIRVLPVTRWFPRVVWQHIRMTVLVVGVLGALVASSTGEMAEHLVRPNRQIVEMHALFAGASIWLYVLIAIGEFLPLLMTMGARFIPTPVVRVLIPLRKVLSNGLSMGVLAVLGAGAITLTGLLGGVLVYGVSADPFAALVLKVLGL